MPSRNQAGCTCCSCTLSVIIHRTNGCFAIGAHVKLKLGGTVIVEGDTDDSGQIDFGTATPGTTYTIEWTYYSLSGSTTGACGFNVISVANPPDSGLFDNCQYAPPSVLYVTDEAGTRQVWPTPECIEYDRPGRGFRWYSTTLTPLGSCTSPSWELDTETFTWGTSGGVPIAPCDPAFRQLFDGHNTFTMPCTRPYSYSGNYPPIAPFGAPSHPFPSGAFVFHE